MRFARLSFVLSCVFSWSCLLPVSAMARPHASAEASPPTHHRGAVERLVSTSSASTAKVATDSFYVYGGPGVLEGKFQDATGHLPDAQGWFGVDRTYLPPQWRVSTFNAATLGGHGEGNHALWCGTPVEEASGWVSAPGYGNNWHQAVVFTTPPVSDPSVGQTVDLDFYFHHETEQFYDYFHVQFDSAGTWVSVLSIDGTDAEAGGSFPAPGLRFSDVRSRPIQYAGGDYGGENGDAIRVRLLFQSDPSYSDEDGLLTTQAGAVQVDDVALSWSDGSRSWDMESGWPADWQSPVSFVGDFAGVFPSLPELDPCSSNTGPVVAFVDEGQDACPDGVELYDPDAECSTGGTTPASWPWGGNFHPWVVNYNGGLLGGEASVQNEFWSPPIDWDLPGTADDGAEVAGAELRFDVYTHLPLSNGIFYNWRIRSRASGEPWSPWRDRSLVNWGDGLAKWQRSELVVSDLLVADPEQVQIALGVRDMAELWDFPGGDATTAPHYDNVALVKWRVLGPQISAQEGHLAHDGFPVSGTLEVGTSSTRDALDVPFDMAVDLSSGDGPSPIDTGDSVVVSAAAIIPGTEIADLRMVWVLDRNPLFEDAIRAAPAGPLDQNVDTSDPLRWTGEVLADSARDIDGRAVPERFFFDLPDEDFLYPGDVLRYHLRATDDGGRVTTLPADTGGFLDGDRYPRRFTVRALPSVVDAAGSQPSTLLINDAGHGSGEEALLLALAQMGLVEGVGFDTYTVRAPTGGLSNGIGSAGGHGAAPEQLRGYSTIVYSLEALSETGLSDGTDSGSNDASDDLGLLTAWHALTGPRSSIHLGDDLASSLVAKSPAGQTYVQSVLGAELLDADVRDDVGGQITPVVTPVHAAFSEDFVAFGGCPDLNTFDHVGPIAPAVMGHAFTDAGGDALGDVAGSVIHDRLVEGDRKVSILVPVGVGSIGSPMQKVSAGPTRLSRLLGELFAYVGTTDLPPPTDTPPASAVRPSLRAHPTPFNPKTTVVLRSPATDEAWVEIFDLRGRRVRGLHHGPLSDGRHEMQWNGRDDAGAAVASGVYVVRARSRDFELDTKVVLLK